MNGNNEQTNKEVWQNGYISNNTRLNEIDLSKCNKSQLQVYSHPTESNKNK